MASMLSLVGRAVTTTPWQGHEGVGGMAVMQLALVGRAVTTTPSLQCDGRQQGLRGGEGQRDEGPLRPGGAMVTTQRARENSEAERESRVEGEGRVAKKQRRLELPEAGKAERHGMYGPADENQQGACFGPCGSFDLQSMADKV